MGVRSGEIGSRELYSGGTHARNRAALTRLNPLSQIWGFSAEMERYRDLIPGLIRCAASTAQRDAATLTTSQYAQESTCSCLETIRLSA